MIDTLSDHGIGGSSGGGSSIEGSLHSQLVELDLDSLSQCRSNGSSVVVELETAAVRNFNKSMDFGRHNASPRRGSKKPATSSHSNDRKDCEAAYGESYATMGDSFMGESFADLGDQSFAYGNCSQTGGFDFNNDSEFDNCLEILARVNLTNRTDLTTVLDLEEEEEDDEVDTNPSESKDDNEAAGEDAL